MWLCSKTPTSDLTRKRDLGDCGKHIASFKITYLYHWGYRSIWNPLTTVNIFPDKIAGLFVVVVNLFEEILLCADRVHGDGMELNVSSLYTLGCAR